VRDTLADQEARALAAIETLQGRIAQLARDIERETALNRDAGETIEKLDWEAAEIAKAGEGHDEALNAASLASQESGALLQEREADLTELTEDVARLAARHQSAQRVLEDCRTTQAKSEAAAAEAKTAVTASTAALAAAEAAFAAAGVAEKDAVATAAKADETLLETEAARADTQSRESDARAQRSEAEGEANALRAEVAALARLVERDTAEGGQVMDLLEVQGGYEKALGAALAESWL